MPRAAVRTDVAGDGVANVVGRSQAPSACPADEFGSPAHERSAVGETAIARYGWPLAALCLWAACFAFVLVQNPAFFHYDDVEHELLPAIRAIGGDLGLFHWPSLTLRSWAIGYLDAEQVLGQFNPLNRVLMHSIASIDDFRIAAAVFALSYLGLLLVGTHLAARAFGASPAAAAVAGFMMATNNLIVFWFAASWWNILASLPWFALAVWAREVRLPNPMRLVGIAVAAYLAITAAAVHTTIALAVTLFALDVAALRRREPLLQAVVGVAGFAIALCLSAHAWLPLLHYLPMTARSNLHEVPDALSAPFGDLLQFALPMFRPNMVFFKQLGRSAVPIYYIAWFATTSLLLTSADRWRRVWPRLWPLVTLAGVFFVASQGPETVGPTRFAFRFMPFFTFAVLLIVASAATRDAAERSTRRQVGLALAAVAYGIVYSLQRESGGVESLPMLFWIAAVLALIFRKVTSVERRWTFCLLVAVLFFVQTHFVWWKNGNLTNWQAPVTAAASPDARAMGPADYSMIFVTGTVSPDEAFFRELGTGNTALNTGRNLVFGYTPTGHATFNRAFCMFFFGWTCSRGVAKALEPDAATGMRLLDLMRVREVIASPPLGKFFAATAPVEWRETTDEDARTVSRRWVRAAPSREFPGTVSFVPRDVEIVARGPTTAESEAFDVAGRSGSATIVFARMFLDGYRLTLDGEPLEIRPHHGFLLAGTLPPGKAGTLALRFVDPMREWSIGCAVVALTALTLGVLLLRRVRPLPNPLTSRLASPAAGPP